MNQNKQIEDETFRQGITEDTPFILAFIKTKKIRRLNNIPGFITAWRLNPVRQAVQLELKAAQTEAANAKSKEQYEQALHSLIINFEAQAGVKVETVLKDVPRAGLTAAQREQRRQLVNKQLE